MKARFLFMAVLALVGQAWAAPVTVKQACVSAQDLAVRGSALGARLGTSVERVAALAVATNETVYAVKMAGGGTVFVSGGDAGAAVVAFTSATNDFAKIDERSPLWALLRRDAEVRAKMAAAGVKTTHLDDKPDDLRVAPLVKSQWDQTTADGKLCYNRFTPLMPSDEGEHATCGCVATAMAQVMRYHQFPTAAREPVTRTCYVNTYAATKEDGPGYVGFITNLTTQAGVYDWANMPLLPAKGVTDAQCEAIGKLTSDAGISVSMSYNNDGAGSSGAFDFIVPKGLKESFGYANADYYRASEVTESASALQDGVLANLDAGYPVLMGIRGDVGGHAIVGDGYGYEAGKLYVHLNMGWSGIFDFWYNLPDVDASVPDYHFTVFDDMICNIFPDGAEGNALLTGCVTDEDGLSQDGASVRIYAAGTTTLVATDLTTNGVYGVRVPAGTYDIEVAKAGFSVETRTSVSVAATESVTGEIDGAVKKYGEYDYWLEKFSYSAISTFGNSHGNDVVITEPRAQIVVGAETKLYATLDKAIAGGAALVAAGELSDVTIELLKDIPLKATATVGYACKITTADGVATTPAVTRAPGAALSVAERGTLELKNVNFAKGATTVVTVASGGELRLGAGVDFAVPATVAAVKTADAAGFVLLEGITSGFTLDCAAAKLVKGVFGSSWCSAADVAESAARIANYYDGYGEQRGAAEDTSGDTVLSWADVPVPLTEAAAYFVDASGATVAGARIDRVLAKYEAYRTQGQLGAAHEIVVRDRLGLSLSSATTVTDDLTIRGETDGVTIDDIASGAGFVIGQGASLTVKNLAFDGAARSDGSAPKLNTLFLVNGGSLAVKDAVFENLTSTNCYSPAIAILSGDATVSSSMFENCRAEGTRIQTYGGGGVFVNRGASLALADTTITNCYAETYGGGVFAYFDASVTLSGNMVVADNASGHGDLLGQSDNLHLLAGSSKEASLALSGAVTGDVGVFWRKTSGKTARALEGGVFATAADAGVATASAAAFANDRDAKLVAEASGTDLVWKVADWGDREVAAADAVAVVTPADGGATRYYASLEDAAATLTGDATIEMKANDTLTNEVTIAYAVTLRSADATPVTVDRVFALTQPTSPGFVTVAKGASLVVENLTLSGGNDAGTLLNVPGGSLTLGNGATVRDVWTCPTRNASAVYVADGGMFTMESGALVTNCSNDYSSDSKFEYATGGGVRVTRATAYLKGGKVTECSSVSGGGVAITDKSTVYVSGDLEIVDNTHWDGMTRVDDNLLVSDNSTLYLADALTGDVGVMPGVSANTNVFGRVSATSLSAASLANSAHQFTNDKTDDVGIAVKPEKGAGGALLVWSDALDVNGEVVVNGTNYVMVAGGETLTAEVADMTTNFVYIGQAQMATFEGYGFVVTCTPQTNVGVYTATLTPKKGFAWADGTTAAKTYSWEIRKATYDMSGVTFADETVAYDGESHSIYVKGTLPSGVTVAYAGNGQTEVGVYTVTASFTGDVANYNSIPPLTATLTITEASPDPDPEPPAPEPQTVDPSPIAFQSITKVTAEDGTVSWRLVVTNRVKYCSYRLLSTDDLAKGFTTTNEWEEAAVDGPWTNDVTTTTEKFFWRAEAKGGENPGNE